MNYPKITIQASARIHFNSLKMNQVGGRGCGGIGLSIAEPIIKMTFSRNKEVAVSGVGYILAQKIATYARDVLGYLHISSGVKIDIKNIFPSHIGLGSGTQIGLCVGKGISLLYKKRLSHRGIAHVTQRAGVSGIGYYSFLYGGFIVDGGYRMGPEEEKKTFGDHSSYPPPLISRCAFPTKWKVFLIMPSSLSINENLDENSLFVKNTPVPLSETDAICANTLMGLIPGIIENNYFEFMDNFLNVVRFGTKKVELDLNQKNISKINSSLDKILAYKWERLSECNYALRLNNQRIILDKKSLGPSGRYGIFENLGDDQERYPKNKLPLLSVSSLGPTMFTFLLDGYHDIDFLSKETKKLLGKGWLVNVVDPKNTPFIYQAGNE